MYAVLGGLFCRKYLMILVCLNNIVVPNVIIFSEHLLNDNFDMWLGRRAKEIDFSRISQQAGHGVSDEYSWGTSGARIGCAQE